MKRRFNVRPLVLAGIAATVAIAAASTYPAGAAPSQTTLRTTAKLTFGHSVDLGRRGRSAGDITTFGGHLIGAGLKGRYQAYCVTINLASQQCSETVIAPAGKLVALAVYGAGSTAVTPIVGGTGRYTGARGYMTEREIDNGRKVRLVIHLDR